MRIKRKTAVVVQTHQLTTVHLTHQSMHAWCEPCRAQVMMLTTDEAATLAPSTVRDISGTQRLQRGGKRTATPLAREQ